MVHLVNKKNYNFNCIITLTHIDSECMHLTGTYMCSTATHTQMTFIRNYSNCHGNTNKAFPGEASKEVDDIKCLGMRTYNYTHQSQAVNKIIPLQ